MKFINPRVKVYFPIVGRYDFFKFAVMNGNDIAEYNGNSFIFQNIEEAKTIVEARKRVNELNKQFTAEN